MRFIVATLLVTALIWNCNADEGGTTYDPFFPDVEAFFVRVLEESVVLLPVDIWDNTTKVTQTDRDKCSEKDFHVSEVFTKYDGGVIENFVLFCCTKCDQYISRQRDAFLLEGMRRLSNFEVDGDLQTIDKSDNACINLDGYYESHDSDTFQCIFRIDMNGAFGGSMSSYSPVGYAETEIDCSGEDKCYKKLTESTYELTCCCSNTSCAYSVGYHASVVDFHERYLLTEKTAEDIVNQKLHRSEEPLNFYHMNELDQRKVHCVYGTLTETAIGGYRARAEGISTFDGVDFDPVEIPRSEVQEPQSTCGLKMTFNPVNNPEKLIYDLTIEMGTFQECVHYKPNSWIAPDKICPLDVKPQDNVSHIYCCRDHDGCNHVGKQFDFNAFMKMSGDRTEYGFDLWWAELCGDTIDSFLQLLTGKGNVFCSYYYDIEKAKIVKLSKFIPVQNGRRMMAANGFHCQRFTVLISRVGHVHCDAGVDPYDDSDYPVRDIIACFPNVTEITKRPSEQLLLSTFERGVENEKLQFRCLSLQPTRVTDVLDYFLDFPESESSTISACAILMFVHEEEILVHAGAVADDLHVHHHDGDAHEHTIRSFGLYSEHFISQVLTKGIAYSCAQHDGHFECTLICAGESMCNRDAELYELLLKVLAYNSAAVGVQSMECGAQKCSNNEGCYRTRELSGGSFEEEKEGCLSDLVLDEGNSHLSICLNTGDHLLDSFCNDVRREIGGQEGFKVHRVCCYEHAYTIEDDFYSESVSWFGELNE